MPSLVAAEDAAAKNGLAVTCANFHRERGNEDLGQNSAVKRAPSLRDEHKAHTERTLRAVALRLFASQGYDNTTIEEVTEKAGVSARTFFRYFPTKESVLHLHERLWFQSLTESYLAKPRSMSDVEALTATFVDLASDFVSTRRSLQLYRRALASSATLRGRQQDRHMADIEELAEAVATRRGLPATDESSVLLAAVALLVQRRALDIWLQPEERDLVGIVQQEFKLLIKQFAPRRSVTRAGS
jgi:AcrR family transcriptional regulator